jgi:hypothetical protein
LNQGQHFEELIERAEAARHEDEGDAVFDETNFARKEIMKVDGDIGETIAPLFVRQLDV